MATGSSTYAVLAKEGGDAVEKTLRGERCRKLYVLAHCQRVFRRNSVRGAAWSSKGAIYHCFKLGLAVSPELQRVNKCWICAVQ